MATSNWKPYKPSEAMPWNLRRVSHLHRRVVFGASWSELQRDLSEGPEKSVSRILEGRSRDAGMPEDFEHLSSIIGNSATESGSADRLKAWWLYRCLFSPHPLQERLTLMWHNHFATSNLKVNDLRLMKGQNETLRKNAFAPFGTLLKEMTHDPALLEWLDAPANHKEHPNENLGRELMELFTLGIGNYTEDDVKHVARALTGWTVRQGAFRDQASAHDDGEKTILGKTGNWSGDDLVQMLCEHPATSRRLAWRITNEFFGEGVVSDTARDELAEGLRQHTLDIRWCVETVLRSELFFSDANIQSRVCDPVSYAIIPLRALELWRNPISTLVLAEWTSRMGQDLFYPPNVGGWNGGRTWLSTRTVVARTNYVSALMSGQLTNPIQVPQLATVFESANPESKEPTLTAATPFLGQLLCPAIAEKQLAEIGSKVPESSDFNQSLCLAARELLIQPTCHLH
jgi:uncharacterized protein (DUF1800 family)